MKVLIIEDEVLASEKLSKALLSIDPNIQILACLSSVDQSLEWFKNNPQPELIFSDIHLSDGLCFNIYAELEINCPIIFTTAYEKYALKAFEVNSIDYLLKPIQVDKLEIALEKYNKLSTSTENKSELYKEFQNILSNSNKEFKTRFLCKLGNKIKSVPVESIMYFYSKDKMTFIVDQDNNRLPINNTLDEIDQLIDPKSFFRVNRQFITHFKAIHEINPYFKGRLKIKIQPKNDDEIVVSTERSPIFKSWLNQ